MQNAFIRNICCAALMSAIGLAAHGARADDTYVNWNGPYVGANVGGAWSDFHNTPGLAGPNGSDGGFTGGGQIGDNWQSGPIVLGVEGDLSSLDVDSRQPGTVFREDWMSTMRGRAGFAVGRLLPYVTGGLGLTDVVEKETGVGSNSSVVPGFAAGAGVDGLLSDRWVGRVEYLHVDVPKDSEDVGGTEIKGGSSNNLVRFGLNYKL